MTKLITTMAALTVVGATSGCVVASDETAAPEAENVGADREAITTSELSFYSSVGSIHSLDVSGFNQNGTGVNWSYYFSQWLNQFKIQNWWWDFSRGVHIQFYLAFYGTRSCYVQTSAYVSKVTYIGGGVCTVN